jgi:opacity protein-like surface antigen
MSSSFAKMTAVAALAISLALAGPMTSANAAFRGGGHGGGHFGGGGFHGGGFRGGGRFGGGGFRGGHFRGGFAGGYGGYGYGGYGYGYGYGCPLGPFGLITGYCY